MRARFAADDAVERVLGIDTVPPPCDLCRRMGRAEFIRADIPNPLIAKVISGANVDTVVHASLSPDPSRSGSRVQLLAACQRSDSVRRLVVKSTTAVYWGERARPRDVH